MEIEYADSKLKKTLTNERLIKQKYTKFYINLVNRLSELHAADNLGEIPVTPPPRRHKLTGNRSNCWGVCISRNYRIVISPIGDYTPDDVSSIKCIRIESIEDYH